MPQHARFSAASPTLWIASSPTRPKGDITKLTGSDDEYRLRVGDWRVRFIREDDTVYVLRVLPRGRAYRD